MLRLKRLSNPAARGIINRHRKFLAQELDFLSIVCPSFNYDHGSIVFLTTVVLQIAFPGVACALEGLQEQYQGRLAELLCAVHWWGEEREMTAQPTLTFVLLIPELAKIALLTYSFFSLASLFISSPIRYEHVWDQFPQMIEWPSLKPCLL